MKKKLFIIIACVLVLAIIIAVPIIVINRPKSLFSINPNEVATINIQNGGTGQITNITNTNEINQIVEDLNNFRYTKKQGLNNTPGWTYGIDLVDSSGNSFLTFSLVGPGINYGNNSYEIPANSTINNAYFSKLTDNTPQ